ncbi:MAG: Asp-tRNA(Asn)/Glu-tRNA(Gln) amidotransferase subunit GatB [Cytophagales bacterium]
MSVYDKYQPVIGLEVHAQLLTKTKAFSWEASEYGAMPNTNISVVTLAHPGTLPKANKKAVEFSMKMGLACGCEITRYNFFDRKNYFYPDLPKGYQITQDKAPICKGGEVRIKLKDGSDKIIKLNRIHMEEDAGKSMHLAEEVDTLVDLNRAGTPLIEIVSEPDLRDSDEAYAYLTEIKKLVEYLEVCDGNMEEGSLRCDANVSVMLKGATEYGKKVELKNMNSFRNVQRAIEHEIKRQIDIIEAGGSIFSETRTFDATTGESKGMRTKEDMNDYRYFPEPDLQPVVISDEWLAAVKAEMPALPSELFDKFTKQYGLPEYDAFVLTDEKGMALYFDEICNYTQNYKAASNWMMGAVKSYLNELTMDISQFSVKPEQIAELIALVDSNKVSNSVAKDKIYPEIIANPSQSALSVAERLNLIQQSDAGALQGFVDQVVSKFPEKAAEYKAGKKGLIGMFMGEVMKLSGGKADPKVTTELLKKKLEE